MDKAFTDIWIHCSMDPLPCLSLCPRHIWERWFCSSEVFDLLQFFPLHFNQNHFFFFQKTSSVRCLQKPRKSEAIYTFSLKNLNPLYKPEKKKDADIRHLSLEFSICWFCKEEEQNPKVEL